MSSLQNKIDFVALVSVTHANSNGDPLNGNRPRTDLNGFGEISDVSKISTTGSYWQTPMQPV